jgi:titin
MAAIFALPHAFGADIFVTNTSNSGPGSLRQAIIDANVTLAPDNIKFAIPGSGPHTINITTQALPSIIRPVVIDGFTQPGSTPNTNSISQGSNAVYQVQLNFSYPGGQYALELGLNAGGSSSGSTIQGLVIGNVQHPGGGVIRVFTSNNTIRGNYIGTNLDGTAPAAGGSGIDVASGANNTIGGANPADRNVILRGVHIAQANVADPHPNGTIVQGNYLGTNAACTAVLDAGTGWVNRAITIGASPNTLIGGSDPEARNVIGTSRAGTGIGLGDNQTNTTGRNIQGNYIGLTADGTALLQGLNMAAGVSLNNIKNVHILNNAVAGSTGSEITLFGVAGSFDNMLQGNYIGTDATGMFDLSSANATRINLASGGRNTVGGVLPGQGNVISGNANAVQFNASSDNKTQGNYIGVAADGVSELANTGFGISVGPASLGNLIGGTEAGAGNIIANSGRDGILINVPSGATSGNRNAILGNSIYDNGSLLNDLGIDIFGTSALYPNGSNPIHLSSVYPNYPEISLATSNTLTTHIEGTITGTISATYPLRLEFFDNLLSDTTGLGPAEGRSFLGFYEIFAAGSFMVDLPVGSKFLTSTATDSRGNTSEFSGAFTVTQVAPPVAGVPEPWSLVVWCLLAAALVVGRCLVRTNALKPID